MSIALEFRKTVEDFVAAHTAAASHNATAMDSTKRNQLRQKLINSCKNVETWDDVKTVIAAINSESFNAPGLTHFRANLSILVDESIIPNNIVYTHSDGDDDNLVAVRALLGESSIETLAASMKDEPRDPWSAEHRKRLLALFPAEARPGLARLFRDNPGRLQDLSKAAQKQLEMLPQDSSDSSDSEARDCLHLLRVIAFPAQAAARYVIVPVTTTTTTTTTTLTEPDLATQAQEISQLIFDGEDSSLIRNKLTQLSHQINTWNDVVTVLSGLRAQFTNLKQANHQLDRTTLEPIFQWITKKDIRYVAGDESSNEALYLLLAPGVEALSLANARHLLSEADKHALQCMTTIFEEGSTDRQTLAQTLTTNRSLFRDIIEFPAKVGRGSYYPTHSPVSTRLLLP